MNSQGTPNQTLDRSRRLGRVLTKPSFTINDGVYRNHHLPNAGFRASTTTYVTVQFQNVLSDKSHYSFIRKQ